MGAELQLSAHHERISELVLICFVSEAHEGVHRVTASFFGSRQRFSNAQAATAISIFFSLGPNGKTLIALGENLCQDEGCECRYAKAFRSELQRETKNKMYIGGPLRPPAMAFSFMLDSTSLFPYDNRFPNIGARRKAIGAKGAS